MITIEQDEITYPVLKINIKIDRRVSQWNELFQAKVGVHANISLFIMALNIE